MNNEYIKIIQQLKDGFQKNKGRGYCYLYNSIDPIPAVADIVISLKNKNPNRTILIALEEYKYKSAYREYIIKRACSDGDGGNVTNPNIIKFLEKKNYMSNV